MANGCYWRSLTNRRRICLDCRRLPASYASSPTFEDGRQSSFDGPRGRLMGDRSLPPSASATLTSWSLKDFAPDSRSKGRGCSGRENAASHGLPTHHLFLLEKNSERKAIN